MLRPAAAFLLAAAVALAQQGKGERPQQGNGPDVDKAAPDFKLKTLKRDDKDKEKEVKLSELKDKPTLLIFGSYT